MNTLIEPITGGESKFYAPPSGYFTNTEGAFKEAPLNSAYILEKKENMIRFYGKAGQTSSWSFEGDGEFEEFYRETIRGTINGGIYRLIPFPSSFCSRGLSQFPI